MNDLSEQELFDIFSTDNAFEELLHVATNDSNQSVVPVVSNQNVVPVVSNQNVVPVVNNQNVVPVVSNQNVVPFVSNVVPVSNQNVIQNQVIQQLQQTHRH